jgi:hypothetical protein
MRTVIIKHIQTGIGTSCSDVFVKQVYDFPAFPHVGMGLDLPNEVEEEVKRVTYDPVAQICFVAVEPDERWRETGTRLDGENYDKIVQEYLSEGWERY